MTDIPTYPRVRFCIREDDPPNKVTMEALTEALERVIKQWEDMALNGEFLPGTRAIGANRVANLEHTELKAGDKPVWKLA